MSKKRNDRKQDRRAEALLRNEAWAKLTPQQQLAKLNLDHRGATKQRAKIQAKIDGSKT